MRLYVDGTLRWQAPELLNGATRLTPATDVYAFSICCVEILGMGDLPYGHRDDKLVVLLVLGESLKYCYPYINNASIDQDKRAEIPSTRFTGPVEPLIQECWARDPGRRPAFRQVTARLEQLRRRQGWVKESPVPVQPELLIESPAFSQPDHRLQSMRLPDLPGKSTVSEAKRVDEPVSDDAEPMSATSCWSQPKPFHQVGRPCYNPSHHHREPALNHDTGTVETPPVRYSGTVIYTPSCLSCMGMGDSDTTSTMSSHFTSSHITVQHHNAYHSHPVGSVCELALPPDEYIAERRNECRFRSLVQSRHGFHHSRTFFFFLAL